MKDIHQDHFIIDEDSGHKTKTGEFFCILDGKKFTYIRGLLNNIRRLGYNVKQFYDEFYKSDSDGICVVCENSTKFKNLIEGYSEWCSCICAQRDPRKREIISKRFVGHPEKLEASINKRTISWELRTEDQRNESAKKKHNTVISKYGENYLSDRQTSIWSNRTEERKQEITDKATKTKIELYANVVRDPFYKSTNGKFLWETKEYHYQGYEDAVLKFLFRKYGTDCVLTGKNIPRIPYGGNKSGIYRPDIYLPDLNLIIEVKSDYTFGGNKEIYQSVCEKQISTLEQGYNHVILSLRGLTKNREMFDEDVESFTQYLLMSISSQASGMRKVQRLSGDAEYRPIAIGSGSGRIPKL